MMTRNPIARDLRTPKYRQRVIKSKRYDGPKACAEDEREDHRQEHEATIAHFYSQLLAKQEPLGKEFEAVLYDNLWDLYVRT